MSRSRMRGRRLEGSSAPQLNGSEPLIKAVVRERVVGVRQDVLRQGEIPGMAHILLEGHTCRYRMLSDGRRQITAVLVPGDVCDLEAVMRGRADYSVAALTACTLGEIPADRVSNPVGLDPEMTRALWRRLLRDEAISREWLVSMGKRTALERLAHLFCELAVRLKAVGLARDDSFDFQITQAELADVLGLSCVHVNRTLQDLRRTEMIQMTRGRLTILDFAALEHLAGFDPIYLQAA